MSARRAGLRRHSLVLALLASWLALASGTKAAAPPSPLVVLLTNHADVRIVPLLRAELERAGLAVVLEDRGPSEIAPEQLVEAARSHNAFAGFRVLVRGGRVDVWIADRVTGKISLREVLDRKEDSRERDLEIALRAVELLRVSLMELEAPHPTRGEMARPAGVDGISGFPESREYVSVRVGAHGVFVGLGPSLALGLDARVRVWDGVHVGVLSRLPLAPSVVAIPEGRIEVSPLLVGGVVGYGPSSPSALLRPDASLGVLAMASRVVATGAPPFFGSTHTHVTPVPVLHATLALAPLRWIHVMLEGTGGIALRELGLDAAGREAAVVGPWVASVGAGLELVVP